MSNVNADTKNMVFYTEAMATWLAHFAEDIMDQKVVKTDMKLRHIFNKAVEVIQTKKRNDENILTLRVELFIFILPKA